MTSMAELVPLLTTILKWASAGNVRKSASTASGIVRAATILAPVTPLMIVKVTVSLADGAGVATFRLFSSVKVTVSLADGVGVTTFRLFFLEP